MISRPENIAALIVAAGRGTRAGGEIPKQYQKIGGESVLTRSARLFLDHPSVASVTVVIHPDDTNLADDALPLEVARAIGGATRDASVAAGLAALPASATHVLIHDAARPLTPASVIDGVIAALETAVAAAPGLQVTDALWRANGTAVSGITPRDGLWRAQTPQGFELEAIRAAHAGHPGGAADDVEVALHAGLTVEITSGSEDSLKITRPEDFARAQRVMSNPAMDIRLGNGYDVHRFADGDAVTLCGVTIPHNRSLSGHSDADVGMHAITDAIYGALAEGDIGQHFPPSDLQWKGADSAVFLDHAVKLATSRGFAICNVDCTLVCEQPKIGPHAQAMRAALSVIMALEADRISVKATTSERLGFTGREEGIAAIATATLLRAS